jgi:phospholipid/cholesterol/gamma-HCH transport system permease protein
VGWLSRIGDHTLFYGRALGGTPHAAVHYRREIIRLIAEISMGAGTLAMIGGTVVIVGFLTLAAGGRWRCRATRVWAISGSRR